MVSFTDRLTGKYSRSDIYSTYIKTLVLYRVSTFNKRKIENRPKKCCALSSVRGKLQMLCGKEGGEALLVMCNAYRFAVLVCGYLLVYTEYVR